MKMIPCQALRNLGEGTDCMCEGCTIVRELSTPAWRSDAHIARKMDALTNNYIECHFKALVKECKALNNTSYTPEEDETGPTGY